MNSTEQTNRTDHVVAVLNRDMMDDDTLAKARAEYRKLNEDRRQLVKALANCVEIMTRVFPDGLPVERGTFCEEHDWNANLNHARSILAGGPILEGI